MSYTESVFAETLSQDLHAAKYAFEKEDFEYQNILANRLMSDALFMSAPKKRQAILAGIFLRDVAFEMIRIRAFEKNAPVATASAAIKSYVTSIIESAAKGNLTANRYWEIYNEYSEKIRKYGQAEAEHKSYSENRKFTAAATDYLLNFLEKEHDLLFDSRNLLLEGILNEIIRIYRVNGANLRELVTLTLLSYLERVYNYVRFAQSGDDRVVNRKTVTDETLANLAKISELLSSQSLDLEKCTDLLESLAFSWRKYYIRYMEPSVAPVGQAERGVELPPETKKKITEAITKELDKETKTK